MAELRTTHESTVTEDQIDHLGHMNVAFYALERPGRHPVRCSLTCRGGATGPRSWTTSTPATTASSCSARRWWCAARSSPRAATGLRLHHELAAADSGVLAATFVHGIAPLDEAGDRHRAP